MTQRNSTDDPFARKLAARRELMSEAYDLICDIAEIEGGDAETERTQERAEIFEFVWQLPRFDKAARRAIMRACPVRDRK